MKIYNPAHGHSSQSIIFRRAGILFHIDDKTPGLQILTINVNYHKLMKIFNNQLEKSYLYNIVDS